MIQDFSTETPTNTRKYQVMQVTGASNVLQKIEE